MPQINDITVKKADGTTDIVWSAVVPSSGDKSPAVFKSASVGTVRAANPTFSLIASSNGPGTARRVRGNIDFPQMGTDSLGRQQVVGRSTAEFSFLLPTNVSASEIAEIVAQTSNLLSSSLIQDSLNTGYAPS